MLSYTQQYGPELKQPTECDSTTGEVSAVKLYFLKHVKKYMRAQGLKGYGGGRREEDCIVQGTPS